MCFLSRCFPRMGGMGLGLRVEGFSSRDTLCRAMAYGGELGNTPSLMAVTRTWLVALVLAISNECVS